MTLSGSAGGSDATTGQASADRLEVSRVVVAPAAAVFEVLTDPQGHVDIDASGMLMDATGERVTRAGDSFVVHMDREALGDLPMGEYEVEVIIRSFTPDEDVSWTIIGRVRPPIGHVYGYRLEPLGPGDDGRERTRVVSYYDWSTIDPHWREAGIFPVISEANLKATLGILARTVARRARDAG